MRDISINGEPEPEQETLHPCPCGNKDITIHMDDLGLFLYECSFCGRRTDSYYKMDDALSDWNSRRYLRGVWWSK